MGEYISNHIYADAADLCPLAPSGWTALLEPLRADSLPLQRRQLPDPLRADSLPELPEARTYSQDPDDGTTRNSIYGHIEVFNQYDECDEYKIKWTTPLRKLMAVYCKARGLRLDDVRFTFGDVVIEPHHTPEQLHLEECPEIDAYILRDGAQLVSTSHDAR